MRRRLWLGLVAGALGCMLAVSGAFAMVGDPDQPPAAAGGGAVDAAALATADDLGGIITALQQRLQDQPSDAGSWAVLGLAYVEQARVSGDPTYYPKAAGALERSLEEQPEDNALALAGRAGLAAARHHFRAALRAAEAALAVNPYEVGALALRVDALTELGRYGAGLAALDQADRRRPSVQIFARYSYARELRGESGAAADLLRRALDTATTPEDRAYLLALLADLHRKAGRLGAATQALADARAADPDSLAAAASGARLAVARGDLDTAARRWAALVQRAPLPEYVLALAELYDATGRQRLAVRQYDVLEATAQLAAGNGVDTDLETARYEADHGSPITALRAARAGWRSAPSIWAADALAWALHRNGRDRAALDLARQATRLGTSDPLLWIHRGGIEAALGLDEPAARHLRRGLAADPGLSPWQVAEARLLVREVAR